ncbi:integrase arm-type DNA-binding domain-containing protein [Chelatococcus sp. XZ-Ab1]|uniref:tyrosine-type recombinase/integrase n=1 Tax=Chelatococcus sp. XZ-Ab1 TaxID=3034027 RepID=UPI0023E4707F|nr:integrase arm-type DNA-binding domain-containing protein [Chelatococcus sp. XZ-Ab1]
MPLTDVGIRALKPGPTPRKISDGGGLHLLVSTAGGKLWRWSYRFAGKQKTLALGAYPDVALAEARQKRDQARQVLKRGEDPAQHTRLAKLTAATQAANTFDALADEYLAKLAREGRAEATINKTTWLLDFARGSLGARPVAQISAVEVLDVLRKVEGRGRHETARRLRSTIGSVFRYAIATARAESDPTFALRGALTAPQVKHRAALTDPNAFGGLLRAIAGYDGQPTTSAALQLLSLTFVRPGELRLACWDEFDLGKGVWTIPAGRTKMRRPHAVPLARQTLVVLRELQPLTGYGKLLLPGYGRGSSAGKPVEPRPISENTLNAALRRMGYGSDEMSSHGFRAVASSLLNESGRFNPDAIERQLAHVEANDVRRAYHRAEYWDERVAMMQWWADHLDALRDGDVRPFKRRGAA